MKGGYSMQKTHQSLIPAIRDMKDMEKVMQLNYDTIVLLECHIGHLEHIIHYIRSKKTVFIWLHIDLIKGISHDEYAVEYIIQKYKPDGIITTKPKLIQRAKKLQVKTILRLFIIDSQALKKGISQINSTQADFIEILPGTIYKTIEHISKETEKPIIAGGLIQSVEECELVLSHGAQYITTSHIPIFKHYDQH